MKKTLFFSLIVSGLLFAQSNNVSGNSISTQSGNVVINQSNNQISNQEIEINKKIDNEFINVSNSNFSQSDKNFIASILNESKNINKEQVPLEEKNRQCKFKVEASAKLFKFGNVNLALSYCDKIF